MKDLYVVFTEFQVGEFAERMRKTHPEWKESAHPDNPLKSDSFLKSIEHKLREKHPEWSEAYYPERSLEE